MLVIPLRRHVASDVVLLLRVTLGPGIRIRPAEQELTDRVGRREVAILICAADEPESRAEGKQEGLFHII